MKQLFFILCLGFLFSFTDTVPNVSDISNAIKQGDVATLSKYFDEDVEVAVMDDEDVYAKADAIQKVEAFFSKYRPSAFSQVHQGTSKGKDSQYLIGDLKAGSSTFRVYVYIKTSDNKYRIQELRFDKE